MLKTIGMGAFAGDYRNSGCSFTTITLPEGLTSLGANVFGLCTKLTSIKLPGNILCIPGTLFAGCSSLAEVEVMGDITQAPGQYSIESGAFNNCTALERIIFHCPAPDKTTVNIYAFSNIASGVEVHFPSQYPEWAQNKPLDVNGNKFVYVADPSVKVRTAELRARPAEDGLRDIRFIAVLTPAEGFEVTSRYAVFTLPGGSTHTLDCPLNYAEPEDGTIVFTAVIKGIPPKHFGSEFTCRFFIEYEGGVSGAACSEPITVSVNGLEDSD